MKCEQHQGSFNERIEDFTDHINPGNKNAV